MLIEVIYTFIQYYIQYS